MIAKKFGGQDAKLYHCFDLKTFSYEPANRQSPQKAPQKFLSIMPSVNNNSL